MIAGMSSRAKSSRWSTPSSSQDASHLAQRRLLVALPQVVQHERGEHALEGAVGVGQRVAEPLVERQHDAGPGRLAPGARERRRVGIDPDDGDPGMSPRDSSSGQAAGAAAEVEHALTGLERGLLHQRGPGGVATEEPVDRIVERQQPAGGRRRGGTSARGPCRGRASRLQRATGAKAAGRAEVSGSDRRDRRAGEALGLELRGTLGAIGRPAPVPRRYRPSRSA